MKQIEEGVFFSHKSDELETKVKTDNILKDMGIQVLDILKVRRIFGDMYCVSYVAEVM